MRRKNRFKEIKIKPKTYRISGKGNKSILSDICGIVATPGIMGGDPMPHPFNQAL